MGYLLIGVGFFSGVLLFWRFPTLKKCMDFKEKMKDITPRISIVIPVRNEEYNLPILLASLKQQSYQHFEVICVDDGSNDNSWNIIKESGHTGLQVNEKPSGWTGKSYACHIGSMEAKGDLLLFLDADVRLERDALKRLIAVFDDKRHTISILPYHWMVEPYEQMSFFFNLIQYAGNGLGLLFKNLYVGLFGPVILMEKATYELLGGHEWVRSSVVDDVELGMRLKESALPFSLYLGQPGDFSYRMYSEGFGNLYQGWVKNLATGASKVQFGVVLLIFLWLSSLGTVITGFVHGLVHQDLFKSIIHVCLYVVWVAFLLRWGSGIGNFRRKTCLFYPLHLVFFFIVFFDSLWRIIWGLDVRWKDRNIDTGGR